MPASTEARIRGACAGVEAAMTRASGPAPSTSSIFPASPPTSLATTSALFGSASPTSISLTPGSRESTPACRAPIRPAPSSPTFIRILSVLYAKQRAQLLLPDLQVAWGVRLGNEREASVDLGVDGFAVCGFRGLLDANLTHRVGVLGYCGVHVAAYYRLGCLDGPVHPNEDRVALVRLKGLYRAEGHLVVGREDGVHVRVGLENVLHGAHGLEPVVVRRDIPDDLDVGAFNALTHASLPLVSGNRAGDARYEADGPLAVHPFLEVASCFEAGMEVVRAYVGVLLLPARYVGVDQDHGPMAPVTVERPSTDPTERSIPATRMTKSWPMANTARTEVWTATLEMLAPVRNTGLRSVMASTRSSRMMTGPSRMKDKLRRMDLSVAPPT